MSTTAFERDAELVRQLLHKHLPSARQPAPNLLAPHHRRGGLPGFSPLTIGEVACQVRADRDVPAGDQAHVLGLLALDVPLPPQLKVSQLQALTPGVTLSAAFWRVFRDTAILMGLAQAHARARRG